MKTQREMEIQTRTSAKVHCTLVWKLEAGVGFIPLESRDTSTSMQKQKQIQVQNTDTEKGALHTGVEIRGRGWIYSGTSDPNPDPPRSNFAN